MCSDSDSDCGVGVTPPCLPMKEDDYRLLCTVVSVQLPGAVLACLSVIGPDQLSTTTTYYLGSLSVITNCPGSHLYLPPSLQRSL